MAKRNNSITDSRNPRDKKNLVNTVTTLLNNPTFVKRATNTLYVLNGLGVAASTIFAVNSLDAGNYYFSRIGLLGELISSAGLYATYKYAQASSDVCEPLLK